MFLVIPIPVKKDSSRSKHGALWASISYLVCVLYTQYLFDLSQLLEKMLQISAKLLCKNTCD